ncbi:hypothetical protein GIB67_009522 [Kingdonia uniflora]|uniref:RNA polymerase-associated protein LEO1 n=1 Tax=Kingdonia uniflora TaxID=39325 RepID=A0A7J7NVZ9_9MAGN|nr:hypothetical protein GIB67_009522 [Kingdonia uniflora]
MGEEKRNQMMQNLFGDQSEDEEEVDSAQDSTHQPDDLSGEGESGAELEGESNVNFQQQEEVEIESETELGDADPDLYRGEGEGDKAQSSFEREVSNNQRPESEGKEGESDEQEEYGQRVVTSRRRDIIDSESEKSNGSHYDDNDDEVDQARTSSKSRNKEKDPTHLSQSVAEMHVVFGDSEDEDELADYATRNDRKQESHGSPMDEEDSYEKNLEPEDIVPDEDAQYESEEDKYEQKSKEKPVGPPLELEIPLRLPPGLPDKMNMIRISNIMGIEPKPFDPKTYTEEDMFETDESGSKKRIRLENNVVRWRSVHKPDGTKSYESNARFVKWSDGSIQLLIGNEVLDISVQEAQHDQAHLFLRHGKGILQSQGKLQRKMRFMPSSLSSNSHRLLTALVDSRHKKVYKVKNCITEVDPEKEREEKIKAASQTIRANTLLHRKREKVSKKYTSRVDKRRQLSPGFLEDALSEEDEHDYTGSRRSAPRSRYDEDWEAEARAEKRIMSAKRPQIDKDRKKSSLSAGRSSRRPAEDSDYESDREESVEYESGEEDELSRLEKRAEDMARRNVEEDEDEEVANDVSEEEIEEPRVNAKDSRSDVKHKEIESDEESPPRKQQTMHRRKALVYSSDEE